jgi:hypothetical protein
VRLTGGSPDRMIMLFRDLDEDEARGLAWDALYRARQRMPRVTGTTAQQISPIYGRRWFGLSFPPIAWYMEHGTGPRTMANLAGKTIPMWITDTDGSARRENPKAEVRVTEDGRTQVRIFRRAAKIGARVQKTRQRHGRTVSYSAPASYPGAPGRINRRVPGTPWTPAGGRGGAVAGGNGGVRWRHPGIKSMQFMNSALAETAFDAGLIVEPVYAVDEQAWRAVLARRVA